MRVAWFKRSSLALVLALLAGAASCAPPRTGEEGSGPLVFVSILPQRFFVQRIAGDGVRCEVLVGPGQSPATYEPTPRQMAGLADAELCLLIGVPFESAWKKRIADSNPDLAIVDCSAGLAAPRGPIAERDPHVWLDPVLARDLARCIHQQLIGILPGQRSRLERGLAGLLADLDTLDRDLERLLEPVRGRRVLVFHPSWGYLTRRYGLEQVAVESEGKHPGPRHMARIIAEARQAGVRSMLAQQQFSQKAARAVADEIGAGVIAADPLAEDYLENMRRVAGILVEAAYEAPSQKR
ncbi:MAG: zinc ABC transporter substrate-binding protein [Acidobacteriota bacterium]|nr:zinc ABC transporter substrate-binding protein [Acidobacteriota bacterium]MDQ7086499.1 zinc ABC transporter substrate-binding protein [Acidobacteriota bacterium]